jgi:hypothetical protein
LPHLLAQLREILLQLVVEKALQLIQVLPPLVVLAVVAVRVSLMILVALVLLAKETLGVTALIMEVIRAVVVRAVLAQLD